MHASVALLALVACSANAWTVSFYNQCNDVTSPGKFISGSGFKGCAPVDHADCMDGNAGTDQNGDGPTLYICGYGQPNCGHGLGYAKLDNVGGHTTDYNGGKVRDIVSWGVTNDKNCGPHH